MNVLQYGNLKFEFEMVVQAGPVMGAWSFVSSMTIEGETSVKKCKRRWGEYEMSSKINNSNDSHDLMEMSSKIISLKLTWFNGYYNFVVIESNGE